MAMSKDTITGAFYSKPGHNVELSEGNTVAIVGGAYTIRFFNNKITMRRVVFSREPIEIKETFQVHVVNTALIGVLVTVSSTTIQICEKDYSYALAVNHSKTWCVSSMETLYGLLTILK